MPPRMQELCRLRTANEQLQADCDSNRGLAEAGVGAGFRFFGSLAWASAFGMWHPFGTRSTDRSEGPSGGIQPGTCRICSPEQV